MADLLGISAKFIDEGGYDGPTSVNRVTTLLSEVTEDIGFVEAFSHVVVFRTGAGLVLFDTSLEAFASSILGSLRRWSSQPIDSICYTHGHVDHIGGAQTFVDEALSAGHRAPRVVGHTGVLPRFDRYDLTNGYNRVINTRQFALLGGGLMAAGENQRWGPKSWVRPQTTFDQRMSLVVGDLTFDLRHARGETDDHLWAWVPEKKAICAGDFVTWVFPNAGNPQKVQRYPMEWARALREMQALDAELLLPAHGLPVGGKGRVRQVLGDIASALESLVEQTLELMNDGASLDTVLFSVKPPVELMERPYLRPVYDEPEFIVRNIWRLYGGWYDGNPARLKPAPQAQLAGELAKLCGGEQKLAERARELEEENPRLACELVELAAQAAPESREVHAIRAQVYTTRRNNELSLMAKGIFTSAARDSEDIAGNKG